MKTILKPLMLVTGIIFWAGCASIPKEAPELSMELGNQINRLEQSHLSLLHSFFEEKKKEVDEFIMEEWIPAFAGEVFQNQQISEAWNEIVQSGDEADRLRFIVMLGPRLQKKINAKRVELIQPLETLEKEIEREIRKQYDLSRSINNTLTSFLHSAAKVDENRKRYLEMLGVTEEHISNAIDETDQVVSKLLSRAKEAEEKEQKVNEYLHKLEEIREKLNL